MISKVTYRPDIDGLRAIAIASVFLFHLDHAWLPGGFIGVDVFFVISGYLITNIIMTDLQEDRFSWTRFYQRRISRLFPMMMLVTACTWIAAQILYSAQDFASAGVNGAAALLSVANFKYMLQGSYFQISPDAQPFIHFWSLSVEEQFYVFYPLILLVLTKFLKTRTRTALSGIALVSFIGCIALTFYNEKFAFYLLPTRAWELSIGGLVALARNESASSRGLRTLKWLAPAGIATIALSCIFIDNSLPFPGYVAALPVLGTAAILMATQNDTYPAYGFLASRPMVAIGRLSYTLYLWHWPVFSFVDYAMLEAAQSTRLACKVAITIALTLPTYALFEAPLRRYFNHPSRKWLALGLFGTGLAIAVPIGLQIRADNYIDASPTEVASGGKVYEGLTGRGTVLLIGDSSGSMYGKMLRETCKDIGCTLVVASSAAGDALPNPGGEDSALWTSSVALAGSVRPDVLFFVSAWNEKLEGAQKRLPLALQELTPFARKIVLLDQPPKLPPTADRAAIRAGARPPFFEDPANEASRKQTNRYLHQFSNGTVSVVDVASHFDDGQGGIQTRDRRGRQLYHDAGHLSGSGANRIRPAIERLLEHVLPRKAEASRSPAPHL